MKKFIVSTVVALASVSALAASPKEVAINCQNPKGFAGMSASVAGKLKLTKKPNGAYKGTGELGVALFNGRKSVKAVVKTVGLYDDLESVGSYRSFQGSALIGKEEATIYVNFTEPSASYVEYQNKFYVTECK